MTNKFLFMHGYGLFIIGIGFCLFVFGVGQKIFRERHIWTIQGILSNLFGASLFLIGGLCVVLRMIEIFQSIVFVFIGGILMGGSTIVIGYIKKKQKKLTKKNNIYKEIDNKNNISYKTYMYIGWSFIMLFLFLGICIFMK